MIPASLSLPSIRLHQSKAAYLLPLVSLHLTPLRISG
jgi:hypothetical protein